MASTSTSVDAPAPVDAPAVIARPVAAEEEPTLKRKGDVSQWRKHVAKEQRNAGQGYVSYTTKKEIKAREVGPPCQCPKDCFAKVGEDNIKKIFEGYWSMADYNLQSSYIFKTVKSKKVKLPSVGPGSRRKATFDYGVLINNERIVVCKKAYLSIHALGESRVATVLKKTGETGAVPADRRGKAVPHNRTPDDIRKHAHDHIKSLPTCSSHYSRAKSLHRRYLPPGYTHRCCYDLFQLWCEEKNVPADKILPFNGYSKLFSSYNIGTSPPKVDTCSTCDKMVVELEVAEKNKDDAKKKELDIAMNLHKSKAKAGRNLMKCYTEQDDEETAAICMDLQQTLVTPRISTNEAYYKRKLWTYNFGIHHLKGTVPPVMYVWNESVAKRGSCEIASCLLHYITNYLPSSVNKLIVFSDNCGGQNKNLNLCLLMLRFIHSDRFALVKHYFLIPGHSYMPCDRDFGNLETFFRGREIYTSDQYMELMKEARSERPFTVVDMSLGMFLDLQPLQSAATKTQVAKSKFKDGRLFVYRADYRQGMRIYHQYFEEEEISTLVKLQKGRGAAYTQATFDLSAIDLPVKHPRGVALRPEKLADLNHLLRFIPLSYKQWYIDLFAAQGLLAAEGKDDDPDDPEVQEDDFLDFN